VHPLARDDVLNTAVALLRDVITLLKHDSRFTYHRCRLQMIDNNMQNAAVRINDGRGKLTEWELSRSKKLWKGNCPGLKTDRVGIV